MKRFLQTTSLLIIIAFASGCSNSQLQADVDELKAQMQTVSAEAADANQRSQAAEETAQQADQTAAQAERIAEDTNQRLDRMFKKSMMK